MKNFKFSVNRNGGCGMSTGKEANTPPCCFERASRWLDMLRSMLSLLVCSDEGRNRVRVEYVPCTSRLRVCKQIFPILIAFTLGVGNVWGANYTGSFANYTGTLIDGYYLIVASNSASSNANYAMGSTADSNKRIAGTSVTISSNTISNPNDQLVFLIESNAAGTGFCFKNYNTGKYVYYAANSSGKALDYGTTAYYHTLSGYNSNSPVGYKFTIAGSASGSNNVLKYNTSSKWFSGYSGAYSTSMTPVRLFRLAKFRAKTTQPASGSFTASATSATWDATNKHLSWMSSGATVTLTATPPNGKEVNAWTVTKASGGTVSVSNNQFTMPADQVTISVTWKDATPAYTITPATNDEDMGTVSISGNIITGSPKSGCRYASPAYTVTSGTATVSQSGNAFTVTPSTNCTVTINFEAIPTHTVTWSANGSTTSESYQEGASIDFPESASGCIGKTFVGWVAEPIAGETDDEPTFVTSANMGTSNVTYYAVFATQGGSGSVTKTDELTYTSFFAACTSSGSNTSGSYTNFSDKSGSKSDAVYAGKLYKHGNGPSNCKDYIQTRSSNSDCGIITTTSGGKAQKVTVEWNSGTANAKVVKIYGKNTAYSAASDLYNNSTSGDLLGTITNGTSTELTITGDYEYIGIRSSDGAIYFDAITIDWQAGGGYTYTNYVTSCCADPGLAYGTGAVEKTYNDAAFMNPLTNSHNVVVTYASNNTSVATVASNGLVTIKGAGSATITASSIAQTISAVNYCADEASYTLTVNKANITPTLTYESTTLTYGGSNSATPTVSGNTGNGTVTYSSSNTSVATVNASTGVVTPVAAGSATITATIAATTNYNGNTATANFTVNKADISPTLTYASTSLTVGGVSAAPTVGGNLGSGAVTYSSSDEAVATVSADGKVTAVAAGSATITATIAATTNYNGNTATANFSIVAASQCVTPSFSPAAGTYSTAQEVTITSTEGATIYYTIDGTEPTTSSSVYDPLNKPVVSVNTTIRAYAVKSGMSDSEEGTATYNIRCALPSFSPAEGTYNEAKSVTISCATDGATIYYTTDGSDPDDTKIEYTGAISVISTQTIKAIAYKTGMTESQVNSAAYELKCAMPTITTGGAFTDAKDVTLSCDTEDATIRYTTDGSEPTTGSTVYSSAIHVTSTTTIKAKAFKDGWTASDEASATYTIQYSVTWKVNGAALTGTALGSATTVVNAGGKVSSFPSVDDDAIESTCGANKFMGWSAGTLKGTGHSAPGDLFADAEHAPAIDGPIVYHAVFATEESAGGTSWNLCSTASEVTEGTYVITWDNEYYLPSETTGTSPAIGSGISVANDKLTNSVTTAMQWTFTGNNTDGYALTHVSGNNTYKLQATNSSTGISVVTNTTNITWKVSVDATYGMLLHGSDGGTRNLAVYNSSSWRYYGTGASYTGTLRLYKYTNTPAVYADYITGCCTDPATALSITNNNQVALDKTLTLASTVGNGGTITWSVVAGTGTATITDGVLYPSSEGTITLKVHQDEHEGKCEQDAEITVSILPETVNVTGVTVAPTSKAILVGETFTITPTVTPNDATDKTVSWTTSATDKATVTNAGVVEGIAAGSATITCTTTDGGKTATTAVTVYSVTVLMQDEAGTDISTSGVSASATGRTLTASEGETNYKFKTWKFGTANGMTLNGSALEGTPTGNVTVIAEFYKPRVIKWNKNGNSYYESTAKYDSKPSDIPANPSGLACAGTFIAWTDAAHNNGQTAKDNVSYYGDALYNNSEDFPAITADETTFYAVFAEGGAAEVNTVMWSEDWTGATTANTTDGSANPSVNKGPGTIVYNSALVIYTESSDNVYVRHDSYAVGGSSGIGEELYIKSDNSQNSWWNVAGIPTGYAATLTLTFNANADPTVEVSTAEDGKSPSISGSYVSATKTGTYTITTDGANTIAIRFSNTTNTRLDNISVKIASVNTGNYVTECNPNEISVTYNANGGSMTCLGGTHDKTTPYTVCADAPIAPTGYEFAAWSDGTNTYGAGDEIPAANINGDLTLTAQWTPVIYNITYNLNGGEGAENRTYTIEDEEIVLPVPTKGNERFDGWFDNGLFTGSAITSVAAGSHGNKEFFANWATRHEIVFDVNGVTTTIYRASDENLEDAVAGQGSKPANPAAPGLCGATKEFVGWTENLIDGNTDTRPADLTDATGTVSTNKHYYPVWAVRHDEAGQVTVFEDDLNVHINSGTVVSDYEKWAFNKVYGVGTSADGIRVGTSSASGSLDLDLSDKTLNSTITLTFKLSKYSSETGNISLDCMDEGATATFTPASCAYPTESGWKDCSVTITNVNDKTKSIHFSSTSGKRVYMKDVKITQTGINTTYTEYATGCNIILDDTETLELTSNSSLSNLTVKAGGTVDASGFDLTVNNLTIESTAGKSGQLLGSNVTVNGNIYMDVTFYKTATVLDETSANQWYMISAPFAVNLNGGFLQTNGTPMVFGTDFDLFYYDGQKRANTGTTGWTRVQGQMPAGRACLIGFNADQSTTIRLKAASNEISDVTSKELENNASEVGETDQEKSSNSDWNGLANPRMRYTNVNKDVYVWDNEEFDETSNPKGRRYTIHAASEYSFVVGTPFFVQAAGENDAISFSTATHSEATELRAPKRVVSERIQYCVRITREGTNDFADQMYVRASDEATNTYEQGHDMITWNGTSGKSALLWSENYGMRLAIEEAPLVNNGATYTLGIFAPKAGQYVISTPTEDEDATLYLTLNGRIIWNLSMAPYTAELQQGQNEGYGLKIVAAPKVTTDVEQSAVSDQPSVQKVIIDEHVYILRGEQMFDVTGKMVK